MSVEGDIMSVEGDMSHLVHSSCTAGAGHEQLETAGLQLSNDLPQEVTEGSTCPHHLLTHHLDIEGIGWVTTSSQLDSELSGGNAKQLLCCLAEVSLPCCLCWAWEKEWGVEMAYNERDQCCLPYNS